jgi:hypothetical protein
MYALSCHEIAGNRLRLLSQDSAVSERKQQGFWAVPMSEIAVHANQNATNTRSLLRAGSSDVAFVGVSRNKRMRF